MCNSISNAGGGLTEKEMVAAFVNGSHQAGSLGWIGDPADERLFTDGLASINDAGRGIVIVKPRVDMDSIINMFNKAEQSHATAVGIDIDGAGLILMKLKGQAVEPKTKTQLSNLVKATTLPFIVKGIMTPDEAVLCAEAGVSAIVVSNHGGRVLDHTPGTASVLPSIVNAVKNRLSILVDGGIRSGVDTLKMLALGADGVLIGRPMIFGAYGGGTEGVQFLLNKYTAELYAAMIMTGCLNIASIDGDILSRSSLSEAF
jgi:isopentenyl diphosphate isomerase/L-lactate dehydrogenase-like FMN-dependent dehydrogenase